MLRINLLGISGRTIHTVLSSLLPNWHSSQSNLHHHITLKADRNTKNLDCCCFQRHFVKVQMKLEVMYEGEKEIQPGI
jgi:hypothetical protein